MGTLNNKRGLLKKVRANVWQNKDDIYETPIEYRLQGWPVFIEREGEVTTYGFNLIFDTEDNQTIEITIPEQILSLMLLSIDGLLTNEA